LSGSLKEHYKEYAGFANGTYNITPDLSVGAGVRYSHNNQHSLSTASGFLTLIGVVPTLAKGASSDNVWTESFDAKWQYAAHSMVYVRAANGYRPGGPVPGGAPFGPDRTWNYEAGLKTSALDGKLTADLAVFYIDWSKIQLNFFNGSHITTGNAGDARSKGVEFEGVYSPIQGLTISANAAYTDAVITKLLPGATGGAAVGDPLPFNSKWTGALRVDYYFPLSGTVTANVGGGLRYKDSFNTTFPGDTGTRFYKLPSTLFTDLRAGLSFDDRLDVSFQILNVANVRKLSNALESLAVPAATADALGQPVQLTYTPGRTFGLSISAKF
jgi:outer membrane receptor protein involved in Fe transport